MSHPIVGFCLSNAPAKKQSSSVPVCNEACAWSRYAENYVKNENKLYRESHVSCAFNKLPGNPRVFSGSLHFFFPCGAWTSIVRTVAVCHNGGKKGRTVWVETTIEKLKVRERFWIPRLRRLVKKFKGSFYGWKKFRARAYVVTPPGNLSKTRGRIGCL